MSTFETLSARRSAYVAAARDNGFEDGLRRLLADLYPDNAHFIYELLQNAEDAGARQVVFELQVEGLRVRHDGSRPFDLRDIESITSIGQSTKADEATSIGKFGVGFKAVFAYTQTPAIHSGPYSFAIRDLFVPVQIARVAQPGWTSFWFPFDRADKPAECAVAEISHALRELSSTTLLFLSKIQAITSFVQDDTPRRLERRNLDGNLIEIVSSNDVGGPAWWYRVTGEVKVDGRSYPAAAAFALESPAGNRSRTAERGHAVTPTDGQVCIYFPAVKEISGLKFHIHAPFASTVARDSVRDDPGNDALIAGIGDLIVRALPAMRDAGMLTDGLLSALPNADDALPRRYALLRDRIIEAFDDQPLTPMAGGGHAPARHLVNCERGLREALTITDARFLLQLPDLERDQAIKGWMTTREGRARAFLDSLDAVKLGAEQLARTLAGASQVYDRVAPYGFGLDPVPTAITSFHKSWQIWDRWISSLPDDRLRTFYVALGVLAGRPRASREFIATMPKAPLVRVHNARSVRHVPGREAYLPDKPGLTADGLVPAALLWLDGDGDDDAAREVAKGARRALSDFYDHAEVRPWDAAAQLQSRFEAYDGQPASVTRPHVDDLRELKRLLDEKVAETKPFRDLAVFVAVGTDGQPYWAPAKHIYLDEPFAATGLAALYQSARYRSAPRGALDPTYTCHQFDVAELAEMLDAQRELVVRPADITLNPKYQASWSRSKAKIYTRVERDWQIPDFDLIVATEDERLLRSLWRTVAFAKASYAEAEFQASGSSPRYALESQLLQSLRSTPWVLDRDGNLRLPANITADELAEGLTVPESSPMLEHAAFGRNAATAVEVRQERELQAKAFGFDSADVLLEIAEAYQADPERMREWLRERKNQTLPKAPSADPEHRAARASQTAADAPERRYETRMRSVQVQVPGFRSTAKNYLTQMYTNDDGVMVCQVCVSPMPFKVKGDYHFEAVQFVTDTIRDLSANRLALCPTCAAMYRYARDTPDVELRKALLAQQVGRQSSIAISVGLVGEAAALRFVGKHAIDLQAAFAATDDAPIIDREPDAEC